MKIKIKITKKIKRMANEIKKLEKHQDSFLRGLMVDRINKLECLLKQSNLNLKSSEYLAKYIWSKDLDLEKGYIYL